jgi:uncharacterized protein
MVLSYNKDLPIPPKCGMGLRSAYYQDIIEKLPPINWLEIHPENYLGFGIDIYYLDKIRELYPLSMHAVGLSLGSKQEVCPIHLNRLKKLVDKYNPAIFSDHLSWSMTGNAHLQDLIPFPYNEESLNNFVHNVNIAQDCFGRKILIENPSSYMQFKQSEMSEVEFINEILRATKCGVLLDINNIYVSCHNHNINPREYIDAIPASSIGEIHLAGHSKKQFADGRSILIDTHDSPIITQVWELYTYTIETKKKAFPTLIEWDDKFPPISLILNQINKANDIIKMLELEKC